MNTTAHESTPGGGTRAGSLELQSIIAGLREVREGSHARSGRLASHCELPSRESLKEIIVGLKAAFFPAHFGGADLTEESIDYFVGHTLDVSLRALREQVRRGLRLEPQTLEHSDARVVQSAHALVQAFASQLPDLRRTLELDLDAAFIGDPAAKSMDEILFCYPGVSALMHHRIAHALYLLGVPLLARIIAELSHADTGIDIHPGAQVGPGCFIDHGTGVVIGETAILGAQVRLYQGVTLGARSFPTDAQGAVIKGRPRHPIIEDHVVIYAGATLLGRITIGKGSTVGGNVWLTRSVPPYSQITQAQVQSEGFDQGAGI